jgi:hypothetical protein
MTLTRWAPFQELDSMERRMRRLLEDVGFAPTLAPAADMYETDEELVVELEVPGFEEKELTLEVTDHMLVIKGEQAATKDEKKRSYRFHERLEPSSRRASSRCTPRRSRPRSRRRSRSRSRSRHVAHEAGRRPFGVPPRQTRRRGVVMTTTSGASIRIRIEAPDADSALGLERRLAHLTPTSVGHDGRWLVELDDDGDRLDEIVAAVRHWLGDSGLAKTAVHVDGVVRHVSAPTKASGGR